jgi:hypothetical protein
MGLSTELLLTIIGCLVTGLTGALVYIFRSIMAKLDMICLTKVDRENCLLHGRQNHEDHRELWERVNHHSHDSNGKVTVE